MMEQTFTLAAAETSTISQQGAAILLTIVPSCAAHSRIIILVMANGKWGSKWLTKRKTPSALEQPDVQCFVYLESSLWSALMTLSPRRPLSDDCIPSRVALSGLSAFGKYYFCNTCYIPVSCWKSNSSLGLMLFYISHSLFSSVAKPVWFPVV